MDAVLVKYYSLTPKQRKSVAEKFMAILDENEEVRKKKGKKTVAKFKKIEKLETERDTTLYNRLRAWRNKTAEEAGFDISTQAWKIMPNAPLMNAAFYRPANEEEFLRVDGFNSNLFLKYGGIILEIITGKAPAPVSSTIQAADEEPVARAAPRKVKKVSGPTEQDFEEPCSVNMGALGRLLAPNKN